MIRFRPCGECAALVPAESGCRHWRPQLLRTRAQDPISVRARLNRKYADSARIIAAQAVAEFRRTMNRGVTG